MTDTTLRYIDIDGTNTRVGFNYIKQRFYVTNTDSTNTPYTTYRDTVEDTQAVLGALGITSVTDAEIENLKESMEYLHDIYYTLQDNGAYIHTLQFNDFKDYPLTIDCEKARLYIMNSPVIYDLTLNESARSIRIPRIISFYKNTLGLLISTEDMAYLYSLLVSYYYPTCYNQIGQNSETGEYCYTDKFILSNYNNTSRATYQCTYNPNKTAPNAKISYVVGTDTTDNTIILSEGITEADLTGQNKVIISGSSEMIDGNEYSADGEYTVTSIEEDGTVLKVEETLPITYEFPYKECYVQSSSYTISAMNRADSTITLTTAPTDVLAGDVILVAGATVSSNYETISCNGTYTVQSIADEVITVMEEIPTDFTGSATLIKELFIGNVKSAEKSSSKFTLTTAPSISFTNQTIYVHSIENEETTIQQYTGTKAANSSEITSVSPAPDNYDYKTTCPQLLLPIPDMTVEAEVLIDVTSVDDDYAYRFPVGEFMVENFAECKAYIGTLERLVKPTDTNKENLYQPLDSTMELETIHDYTKAGSYSISWTDTNVENLQFLSVYSSIYPSGE